MKGPTWQYPTNGTNSSERGMNRFDLIMYILFIGIGSAVMLGLVMSSWVEKRRTDAWRRVAQTLGLSFRGNNDILLNRFPAFEVFSPGAHQRFYNAVEAHAGNIRITVGDFAYRTFDTRTGSRPKGRRHVQTVCVLESDALDTPRCHLRPQRAVFDKFGALFGGQDINFADDRAFSNAFVLRGDDESAVRKLFDARVRAWFTEHHSERCQFETQANRLVFNYGRKREPKDAPRFMQQVLEVAKLLTHA